MQEKEAEIAIFDRSGRIIKSKPRKDIDKTKELLGTVNILLTNKNGEVFTILANDSLWKGRIGGSCAGLIRKEETPINAANRTLERELGVKTQLRQVYSAYHEFDGAKRWFHVFLGKSDNVKPNNKDVIEGKWRSKEEIENIIENGLSMPTFEVAYSKLK